PQFGCGFRLREHTGHRHRRAALTLAFVRGFHEGENLNRFLDVDRGFAGFEEAANLSAEFLIASFTAGLNDAFAAESDRAEFSFVLANPAIGADAPVLPEAGDEVGVFGLNARDRFATGAHQRVQRFNAVDAVEEHVRSAFLISAGPPGGSTFDCAELPVFQKFLNARAEPDRRTREAGHIVLLRQFVDDNGVGERARDRLVDEERLASLNHRVGFLQMNPPVHTFEQHDIHLFEQLGNRIQNLDAHPAQLLGEPFDAVAAGRAVRAAGITSDDPDASNVT